MSFTYVSDSNGWVNEPEEDKGTKRRDRDEDTEVPCIQRNEVFIATPFPKKVKLISKKVFEFHFC